VELVQRHASAERKGLMQKRLREDFNQGDIRIWLASVVMKSAWGKHFHDARLRLFTHRAQPVVGLAIRCCEVKGIRVSVLRSG
jgi:hypothetical protein